MKTNKLKSDLIGIVASALCMLHCIITPFLFIAKTCSDVCCATAPIWWRWVDISFLVISFFAIIHAVKHTSKEWVKWALWTSWIFLLVVITGELFGLFTLFKNAIYLPSLSLVALHFYNLKYCRCAESSCHNTPNYSYDTTNL